MAKPFSLQTVLELMQIRADDATQNLARLIASERDAKSKLELLQQYRDEYALRFQQAAQNGISPREWAKLPPLVQHALLNAAQQSGPPAYREMIKEYFVKIARDPSP